MPTASSTTNNSFISNVTKLSGARVVTFVIGILTAPLFGRLFTPDQVGIFSIFVSAVTFLTTLCALRYDLAIVLPKEDQNAISVFSAATLILLSFVLIFSGATLLGFGRYLEGTNYEPIIPFLWLVVLAVGLSAFGGLINQWLNRKKHYGLLAFSNIMASVTNQVGAVSVGALGFIGVTTLIIVNFVSQLLGLLIKLNFFAKETRSMLRQVSIRSMITELKNYKKFPLIDLWSAVLNNLSVQLAPFALLFFYSADVVGHYSQGMRLIVLPTLLIGSAIGHVFYQKAAVADQAETLQDLVQRTLGGLVLIGGFPFLILGLLGDIIFGILLGPMWVEAGVYSQIFAGWVFLSFCGAPLSTVHLIMNNQGILLRFNIATFVLRTISLVLGGWFLEPRMAIGLYAGVGVLVWIAFLSELFHVNKMPVTHTWLTQFRNLIPAFCCITPLLWARIWAPNVLGYVTVLTVIFYYIYMLKMNEEYKKYAVFISSYFKNKI